MPSFGLSLFVPLIPAILISISTILSLFITEDTILHEIVSFIGSAEISLIIAIITAIVMFGLRKGKDMDTMMKSFETGLKGVATIIFIVGAGGAFKEIILEAHVGDYIADIMKGTNISITYYGLVNYSAYPYCDGSRCCFSNYCCRYRWSVDTHF